MSPILNLQQSKRDTIFFFGPPWQALGLTYDPSHDTSWNVYPNAAVYTS